MRRKDAVELISSILEKNRESLVAMPNSPAVANMILQHLENQGMLPPSFEKGIDSLSSSHWVSDVLYFKSVNEWEL